MTRVWTSRVVPVAISLLAACTETPTTPTPTFGDGSIESLTFDLPTTMPAFAVVEIDGGEQEPVGPARVVEGGEDLPGPGEDIDPSTLPASGIWNQKTRVGFEPGAVWASGSHSYQGNKGSVTTTLKVALDGVLIGSQVGTRQNDFIFWLDFGLPKDIQVFVRVYTDVTCGLAGDASSDHRAWWEAIPGANIATFGLVIVPSQAVQARQADCAPEPPPPPTDGGGNRNDSNYYDGSGGYCTVSVWYDEYTGEIVSWTVLFCENTIGG